MNRLLLYDYPDDSDPEVRKLKRLAARAGRSYRDREKYLAAADKLRKYMATLPTDELTYWADVVMIDPRWNGATGQGGYWAVASELVNNLASELLYIRQT